MTAPTTVAEVLLRAAAIQESRNWGQGKAISPRPSQIMGSDPICVRYAISLAASHNPSLQVDAVKFLRQHLDCVSLPAWNDEPGRTKAEVLTALRETAAFARAEQ